MFLPSPDSVPDSFLRSQQAEARPSLYGTVTLDFIDGIPRRELLYRTLRNPQLGRLIHSVHLRRGYVRCRQFLNSVSLFPSLEILTGLSVDDHPDLRAVSYPPAQKPLLKQLELSTWNNEYPPSDWLDLSALESIEVTNNEGSEHLGLTLSDVSPALDHLALLNFEAADWFMALDAISPFQRLTSLELAIWRSYTSITSDLLNGFPLLRRLRIAHEDVSPVFRVTHAALETLIIGTPPDDWTGESTDLPSTHPLHQNVLKLVEIVKDHPDRFPSLSTVGLQPAWSTISFDTPETRMLTGLLDLAISLRSVGLRFVDGRGKEWRQEWDEEVRATLRPCEKERPGRE